MKLLGQARGRCSEWWQMLRHVPSRCLHVILNGVNNLVRSQQETLGFAQSDVKQRSARRMKCTLGQMPALSLFHRRGLAS